MKSECNTSICTNIYPIYRATFRSIQERCAAYHPEWQHGRYETKIDWTVQLPSDDQATIEKQQYVGDLLTRTTFRAIMDRYQPGWEDTIIVGLDDIFQCNEANIIPQEEDTVIKIRTWLRPTDFDGQGSEYQKHIASHLPGTCSWFLNSSINQQWHASNEHSMLWVRGAILSKP